MLHLTLLTEIYGAFEMQGQCLQTAIKAQKFSFIRPVLPFSAFMYGRIMIITLELFLDSS